MSEPRDPTPQGFDPFGRLPIEMSVKIMLLLGTDELLSLTRASPTAWQHFRADHEFILRSHLPRIYNHYGHPAAIPWLMLLTRLRELRVQLKGNTNREMEDRLDPFLSSILSRNFMEMPSEWESNLPILAAATGLLPEIRHVFNEWAMSNKNLDEIFQRDTWIFIESFLRYECFCNIAYGPEGFLFRNIFDLKHVFFKPLSIVDSPSLGDLPHWDQVGPIISNHDNKIFREHMRSYGHTFNAPFYLEWHYERQIFNTVERTLRSKLPITEKARRELSRATKELEILDVLEKKGTEQKYFGYHLCLQGNSLLTRLLELSPRALCGFITREYSSFIASRTESDSNYHSDFEEMKYIIDVCEGLT
ncbi:uracil catabolism 4 [Fusarium mexicanum]|uniref:Uracil catabolism 4 n=1 Tax=Fusarium mexicanum TaxID=751941 RepID=A0A8H5JPQ2_9HYPO|nr:uracil catabolism 4 [Fusarium mexicanum]